MLKKLFRFTVVEDAHQRRELLSVQKEILKELKKLNAKTADLGTAIRFASIPEDKVFRFTYDGKEVRMHLPAGDTDYIQKRILANSSFYEIDLLKEIRPHVPTGSTVIDAGANIGNHSIYFACICGAAAVHSFEPQQSAFSILQRNAELNGVTDVITPYRSALGASPGRASIGGYRVNNLGATTFSSSEEGEYDVRTIDGLNLPSVDFIKIDVEGAQVSVLEGARGTIEKHRPSIFCELLHGNDDAARLLTNLGYSCKQLDKNNFLFMGR